MRSTLTFIFLWTFSLQTSFSQVYLIDSTASLSFFGSTASSVFIQKYNYDDQYRISQISSEYQVQNYEYYNEYDHSIVNGPADGSTFYGKINNYYNSDGLIITYEQESYNMQTQQFFLSFRTNYEYDLDGNMVETSTYSFSTNGQSTLSSTIKYNYNEGNLVYQLEKYYSGANSLYLTRTTDWVYEDGLLVLESQESIAGNNNNTSYIKTYEYNSEDRLDSYLLTHFTQMESNYQYEGSFEYTDHGVHEIEEYTSLIGNPWTQTQYIYRSFVESLFFEQDTFVSSFVFQEQEFNAESRFNTEHYSSTRDSVLVRRETRQADFEFESFLTIIKELHIIHPESQTNILDEEALAANIFPSPASANSTLIIQKEIDKVDRAELYNVLGQKVDNIYIGSESQIVTIAPQEAGNYYIIYYADNQRIGKVGKLVVN